MEDQASGVYEAYPRKVARKAAIRAVLKAIQAHGFDKVMGATVEYGKTRNGEDQQFTPYPATWFNQQRYLDDPATWRQSNGKPAHRLDELTRQLTRQLAQMDSASMREKSQPGFTDRRRALEAEIQTLESQR